MPDVEFALFDPATATAADYEAITALRARAFAVDRPGTPALSVSATIEYLTEFDPASGAVRTFWTARDTSADTSTSTSTDAGAYVGLGLLAFPEPENTDTAIVFLEIDPDRRRQGIGTAFFRAVLPTLQAAGRPRVMAMNVTGGGGGELFAEAIGGRCTMRGLMQTLDIPAVDPALWDVPAPAGFRLESWSGAVSEELLLSYTQARTAIEDRPPQDLDWQHMVWTPERVRKEEAAFADSGQDLRQALAVHEASGEVAAITEVVVRPAAPDLAQQMDTAVRQEYRGHGLGRAIKAALMRRLILDRPEVVKVATTTASDNSYMIAVNHALGYTDARTLAYFETSLEDLTERLGG